ncbi:MAG: GTP-binding protein [Pirellulaceae bacterium]|jgi:hypothetical protein|nr:GTP-binding protein [Pirellulaceae bacterium]MDP7014557.1 GTP-binding protein [Pirellulaceae bacterium]
MKLVRFLMVGGFLGAGKTTAIARLAKHYTEQGMRVGIVTNDQAFGLVDTESLRAQGFDVGEVPGACFCCKFDDLIETAQQLDDQTSPDVIIAEPVGSCTDLAATVVEPLRHLYGEKYELGPLAVLLKPEHGRKILRKETGVGFSPKAAYIFLKQIEEADIVVLNKMDKLSEDDREELLGLVADRFPGKQVMAASAKSGDNFADLIDALASTPAKRNSFMDVDYDVYAEGEAELGWLNCQLKISAESPFDLDDAIFGLVQGIKSRLRKSAIEAAHLKVLGQSRESTSIANLVSNDADVEQSLAAEVKVAAADCIINARVASDPAELESAIRQSVDEWKTERGIAGEVTGMQRFRPGRPVPTHRMS